MKPHIGTFACALVVLGVTAGLAAAQEAQGAAPPAPVAAAKTATDSRSATAAATLTALLEERKLDAVAARDPEQPGQFFAALYMSGSQLLVVSSPYPAPAALDKRIAEAKYMDVYQDLQSTAKHDGQFFVMDLQADGLVRVCGRDQPFDSTSMDGNKPLSFDGNWDGQQLSESAYNTRFADDDVRYARILTVLAGTLTAAKPSPLARKGSN
jgi:hypothetical protein